MSNLIYQLEKIAGAHKGESPVINKIGVLYKNVKDKAISEDGAISHFKTWFKGFEKHMELYLNTKTRSEDGYYWSSDTHNLTTSKGARTHAHGESKINHEAIDPSIYGSINSDNFNGN